MQGGRVDQTDLPDQKAIVIMLAQCACNNHTICDDELRPIGQPQSAFNWYAWMIPRPHVVCNACVYDVLPPINGVASVTLFNDPSSYCTLDKA